MLEATIHSPGRFGRTRIGRRLVGVRGVATCGPDGRGKNSVVLPAHQSGNVLGGKSFADDLNTERGIVRGRVALLLRSSEIQPLFFDLCTVRSVLIPIEWCIFFTNFYAPVGLRSKFAAKSASSCRLEKHALAVLTARQMQCTLHKNRWKLKPFE